MRVVVTGASGKAGRAVVRDLLEHGHDVVGLDLAPPSVVVDVCDLGELLEASAGADAILHLAAVPAPGLKPDDDTFRINMASTFNAFEAARVLGLSRVVWASSETLYGVSFDDEPPESTPLSEDSPPRTRSSYAMSKLLGEAMGREYWRRDKLPSVALRFSNIMEEHEYSEFPGYWDDPRARSWNLWGYVDARDVAQSWPSDELMAEVFPSVPHTPVEGSSTLVDISKARGDLGYEPAHSWRDHV